MFRLPLPSRTHTRGHRAALPTRTDAAVADDVEPVTTEPDDELAVPDGDDLDTVSHKRKDRT